MRQKYADRILAGDQVFPMAGGNEALEQKEQLQLINSQIEKLPPKCREVFRLSREENLTYKTIAHQLNISENTVDQHIRKALGILRSALKEYYCYPSRGALITMRRKRLDPIEKFQHEPGNSSA